MVEGKRIGARADELEYERAIRSGDRLFLFYCFRRGPERCDRKWSALDLTRLPWRPLVSDTKRLQMEFIRLTVENARRPTIAPGSAVDVPVVNLDVTSNAIGYPGGPAPDDLLARSESRLLSLYRSGRYALFLVSNEDTRGETVFVQAINPTREYLTWWSIPVRASLYAVTVPLDVVALPAELAAIWWVAQGLRE